MEGGEDEDGYFAENVRAARDGQETSDGGVDRGALHRDRLRDDGDAGGRRAGGGGDGGGRRDHRRARRRPPGGRRRTATPGLAAGAGDRSPVPDLASPGSGLTMQRMRSRPRFAVFLGLTL